MRVIAFNGSPRREWNTATLLNKALEGAASQGAEIELIHLYEINFKGCVSCFACKTRGGKSYGKCAAKDDLTPVLKKVEESDAIILGSPIYLGTVTGEMRSFMERLTYPYLTYDDTPTLFPKKINTGFVYTMGITHAQLKKSGCYDQHISLNVRVLKMIFGASESILCTDTYQFDDYSKVVATIFDPEKKATQRKEVFPKDCEKAFEMGVRFAKKAIT